jgi:type IV pilus assembly protein PilM
MFRLPKKVVGIDLHDHSAQVVELKQGQTDISLESYNRVILPAHVIRDGEVKSDREQEFKGMVLDFLEGSNPNPIESKNVAIILPAKKTFAHIFKMPGNLGEQEIKKAIPFEAETIIPFPIQDVYWDITVLSSTEPTKDDPVPNIYVLFAAIPKEIADTYARLFESMGLTPYLFGVNVEALKYVLRDQIEKDKASLIIDLGTLSTNYLILKNSEIYHFFSSNEGGGALLQRLAKDIGMDQNTLITQWREEKLATDKFLPKIKEFIQENYNVASGIIDEKEATESIGEVNNIYLTGEFINLPQIYELAIETFAGKKVEIGDPRSGLSIRSDRFLPMHEQKNEKSPHATYFTSAIGIALRVLLAKGHDDGINLLPDRLKQNFLTKKNAIMITAATLIMSLISLLIGTYVFVLNQTLVYDRMNLEIKKSAIEKMIYGTRYEEIRDAIVTFNAEVTALREVDSSLFSVAHTLDEITTMIPEGVQMTFLQFNDADLYFEMAGIAENREALLDLQHTFEEAPFISEVIAPISNFDEKEEISFVMKLNLNFAELPSYATDTHS